MTRAEELQQAIIKAAREPRNLNGYRRHAPSPISTRTRAEVKRTLNTPDTAPELRPATQAGTGSLADYVSDTVRGRLEMREAKRRDLPKLTPTQIERQRVADFYYNSYQQEQAAEKAKQEAAERARQAKVEAARRHREIEQQNISIAEKNFLKAEIRRILADATPPEMEIVIARVKAEGCENLPDAYVIHLDLLREETAQAVREAERKRMEEQQ